MWFIWDISPSFPVGYPPEKDQILTVAVFIAPDFFMPLKAERCMRVSIRNNYR